MNLQNFINKTSTSVPTMKFAVIFVEILISTLSISAQKRTEDYRISRVKGNILTNITGHQEFVDHIVTSHLDSSPLIRMVYRGIREMYSRLLPDTGERHNSERFQRRISSTTKFPCRVDGFKSVRVPKSVHQLRPGGNHKVRRDCVLVHLTILLFPGQILT